MAKFELPTVSEDIVEKEKKARAKLGKVIEKIPKLEEEIEKNQRDFAVLSPEYEHGVSIAEVLDDMESKATVKRLKDKIFELKKTIETSSVKLAKLKEDKEKLTREAQKLQREGDKELFLSLNSLLWSYRAASVEEDKDYSEEIRSIKQALFHNHFTIGPRGEHRSNVNMILKYIDQGKKFAKA